MDQLERFGVVVIPRVLSDDECVNLLDSLWGYFESISKTWDIPIVRSNPETHKGIFKLYPLHSMLIQHFGIGHIQGIWDVRQNPRIAQIFADLFGVRKEDLLVSFDGASFHVPHETTGRGYYRGNTWFHTDQSFVSSERSIQGWVTALDVEDGDATLSYMEGSHAYHKDFAKQFGVTRKENWFRLEKEHKQFYADKGCAYKRVTCPAGSLVLWDSRLIHCGVEPMKTRERPIFRAVCYVSYAPRTRASESDLKKKRKAFEEGRMTTHSAAKVKLFGKCPRTYGGDIPDVPRLDAPVLTSLGKRLAGFDA